MKYTPFLLALGLSLFAAPLKAETPDALVDKFFAPWMFEDIQLSPGAKYLSFRSNSKGPYGLYVYDLETEDKRVISPSATSDDHVYRFYWIDSDTIMYRLSDGWNYHKETNIIKPDLRYPKPLENKDEKSSYYVFDTLPMVKDECLVILRDWFRAGQVYPDAHVLNVRLRSSHVVARNPGNITDWMADTKGTVRIGIAKIKSGERTILHRVDEKSEWTKVDIAGHTETLSFDPTGKFLMVSTTDGGDNYALATWNLEANKFAGKPFRDPPYDVGTSDNGWLVKAPLTGAVAGLLYNADKPRFIWFDPSYKRVSTALDAALPGMTNHILGFTNEGKQVIVESSSDRDPGGVYRLDLTTGKMKALFYAKPGIKPSELCEMKPISFPSSDGATIYGYLTSPKATSDKLPPLLAIIHGGPKSRVTWGYDDETQYFAALGYAVLQVNYRGSVGMGLAYEGDTIELATRCVAPDVAAGVKWVLAQKLADPDRVAVYGASFGGYGALVSAAQYPELYKMAIGFAGVYDWKEMRKEDIRDRYNSLDMYYGDDPEVIAKIDAISPINYPEKIKCPVMLFHGTGDRRVPISQSKDMATALEKAGVDCKLETKTWVGHGFNDPEKRKKYYLSVTKFLQEKMP
ncbi:MAG: prolyl oligopeptidase family serine peptidase [Verrucomicrobiota bacterium]|nr:prolyl oligopeptidase family serine peptidase [Verrucomicrobiota bacterium]